MIGERIRGLKRNYNVTTKEVINMTFEGLPTAARKVTHAVDCKIAVPLGLERVHLDQLQ